MERNNETEKQVDRKNEWGEYEMKGGLSGKK